jgi:hypothetical protein
MQAGDTVHVTLDRDQAFVFPVDPQSSPYAKPLAQCPPVKVGETV